MRFGPGAQRAPQPGGAELEPLAEPLAQAVEVVGREQRVDLGPGAGIGVVVAPRPRPGAQRRRRRGVVTAGRRPGPAGRPSPRPAARPASSTSAWSRVLVAEAGRQVGDERQPEHLGADVAGRDHLVHGAHAHQVGAERLEHADLRRGLVLRARARPAYTPSSSVGSTSRARSRRRRRVGLGEVDEARQPELVGRRRAGERRAAGEVEVVADEHGLADAHPGPEPAGGVREHDGAAAGAHARCARRAPRRRARGPRRRAPARGGRGCAGRRRRLHRAQHAARGRPRRRRGTRAARRSAPRRWSSPKRSAAGVHPEPRTTSTSCRATPVRSAIAAAASATSDQGSAAVTGTGWMLRSRSST